MSRASEEGAPPDGEANPPRRDPTMREVAAEAGVSVSAVSIALRDAPGVSETTRRHILSVANSLGYRRNRAASLMKLHRTGLIGLTLDPGNPFHTALAGQIHNRAAARRHEVVPALVTDQTDPVKAVEFLLGLQCEGIILLGPELSSNEFMSLAQQVALVLVGHETEEPDLDIVHSSDSKGLQETVAHLIGLGHSRILHIDGGDTRVSHQRRLGYTDAMQRAGLFDETEILTGGQTTAEGRRVARQILTSRPLPTAICAFNDAVALGVYDELTLAGVKVPEHVSLTGYDNTPIAQLKFVNLTSVDQHLNLLTDAAVDAVIARMAARSQRRSLNPTTTVLQPQLVPRGTSGTPREKL